jgi:hypothetical protein
MSASNDCLKLFPSVPRPHSHQITGIVRKVSWRRYIRNGTFHHYFYFLCLVRALRTEKISFPKPIGIALCPVCRSHRLSHLFVAIHPPAQFLRSVLVNGYDLIFTTVGVRHTFLLSARVGFRFLLERSADFPVAITACRAEHWDSARQDSEGKYAGPPAGVFHRFGLSIGAFGMRYKGWKRRGGSLRKF